MREPSLCLKGNRKEGTKGLTARVFVLTVASACPNHQAEGVTQLFHRYLAACQTRISLKLKCCVKVTDARQRFNK